MKYLLTACQKYGTLIPMDEKSCIIYSGQKFSIEWYYDKDGKSVGFDYISK
jgi:RNA polymerase subunit RPABC4/transcription elongation factor Spt4